MEAFEEIQKAIRLAFQAYEERHGKDKVFDEGDEFVTVFNNCVLIISLKNGKLENRFIGGKPLEIDFTVGVLGGEEREAETHEQSYLTGQTHP